MREKQIGPGIQNSDYFHILQRQYEIEYFTPSGKTQMHHSLYQAQMSEEIFDGQHDDPLGMSVSAFNNNFRALTSTSPLQYIKNIRLHKAKELIQIEGEKAYSAALRVGYESTSIQQGVQTLFRHNSSKRQAGCNGVSLRKKIIIH